MDSLRKKIKRSTSSTGSSSSSKLQRSSSARSGATSTGASLMECLRPVCLRSEKSLRNKRPSTPEQKKKMNVSSTSKENISGESIFTSLGDMLLSSPGSKPDSMNGGELYVLRSHYSSRRVHPSTPPPSSSSKLPRATSDQAALGSKARDSFSINRAVKNEPADARLDSMTPSLSRKQSGNKSKKRVSFRLPEEADIVIFYPSDQESFVDCEENFV